MIAPFVASSVYSRALLKAAELLGGRDKLAKALRVPRAELDQWIGEQGKPPRDTFLRVVDLILDEIGAAASDTEPHEPPPRDAAGSSSQRRD